MQLAILMQAKPNNIVDGIGARVLRKEDARFVAGRGRYIDDIALPNTLYAAILRSPVAHGRIVRLDATEARQADPGVIVLSAADFEALPDIPIRIATSAGLSEYVQKPLATDRVRYVGEPIAVVVADSLYRAEDALERIDLEIEALPAFLDISGDAAGASAPLHARGNIAASWIVEKGAVDDVFQNAAIVIDRTFTTGRHSGVPLETRGLLAAYDLPRDLLQVWGPTKLPYINRVMLAQMLGLSDDQIQFVEPDVGGSFGVRGEFYPEDFLIPYLALMTGRPVKWIETRREHFLSINHSREQAWQVKVAADQNGRVLGIDATLINDMGAYIRTHGTVVPHHSCVSFPGPYFTENYRCAVRCVMTNKTPTGTMRAPGMFEATFVRERVMDLLAEALHLAPDEIRRRNFIQPEQLPYEIFQDSHGPYRPAYDNGNFPHIFEQCLKGFDYAGRMNRAAAKNKSQKQTVHGVGLATAVEPSGLGPFERAKLRIDLQGRINVFVGATSQGQGLETTLAQICCEVFDVPIDLVRVRHGDTALLNMGYGTNASRSAVMAGGAVHNGAVQLKKKATDSAAALLKSGVDEVVYEAGTFYVTGRPERKVTLADVARGNSPFAAFLKSEVLVPRFAGGGLEVDSHVSNVPEGTCVFSVHIADVAIDLETGVVTVDEYCVGCDVGRVINPNIVDGQLMGGVVQGIGGALQEHIIYDEDGQILTASFMDYSMPLAGESPPIRTMVLEQSRATSNVLGVKGVGEVGTSGAGAAIANAVAQALGESGRELCSLPLTSLAVFNLMNRPQ